MVNRTRQRTAGRGGFTLVELLVALTISSIVLTAVGTLAHAMSTAIEQTDEMGERQAEVRFATMRLTELVRSSVRIWRIDYNVVLWEGDSNDDGVINGLELTYIQTQAGADELAVVTFPEQAQRVTPSGIINGTAKAELVSYGDKYSKLSLLKQCSSVSFEVDPSLNDENPRFVDIYFDITDNGVTSSYQICATRMGSADNMFDSSGNLLTGDDD